MYTLLISICFSRYHVSAFILATQKVDIFITFANFCRSYQNFAEAKGHGLCLIDFGRAVDLTAFSVFQGSSETDGFQCTQMIEGKHMK